MQIVIDIPEEQIKKSLEESKYMHEDEGEKGFVDIMMLYTDGHLDFVDVSRKTDFYSCKYKILLKGHGRLVDADVIDNNIYDLTRSMDLNYGQISEVVDTAPTIIKADRSEENG